MKKLIIIATLLTALISCSDSESILDSHEYVIMDTTYVNENVYGKVLSYDVILFNRYDSCYHTGIVSPAGKLTYYNPRPVKTLK